MVLGAVSLLLMILGGCVTTNYVKRNPGLTTHPLSTVQLPTYQEGTKFIYSDGTWKKAVKVHTDRVEWVNQWGNPSMSKVDFTYRNLSWSNKKFRGGRSFSPVTYWMNSPPDTLWPLTAGKEASYNENGTWVDEEGIEHSYEAFWHCEVKGEEKLKVPAGEFDTWKLTCSRYSNSKRYPGALSWEDKSWWYSPVIQHWVKQEQDYHGYRSTRIKQLVAVIPDLSGRLDANELSQVKQQFQNVMEYKKRGSKNVWRSTDGKRSVTLIPTKSFKHNKGGVCRQYEQQVSIDNTSDSWYGVACKSSKGSWQIPRR